MLSCFHVLAVFPPCFLLTCVTCSQCFPQVITTSSPCLVWFSLYILDVFSSVFASSPCCSVNLLLCFITELSSTNSRLFAFCSQRDTRLLVNQKQQRLSLRYRLLVQLTAQQTILLLWHRLAVSQRWTVFGTSMLASLSINAFKCYILP